MDLVAHHEAEVGDFLLLQSLLVDRSLADLATQDLRADVVLASQTQLHLVQNEVDFLLVLEGAVGLDGDFLNDLGSLVNFAVSLIHLDQLLGSLRVLPLQEDFALSGRPQHFQHRESLLARGQLVLEGLHAQLDHVGGGFL